MAKLEPTEEQLLQSALEHPFEPPEVPVQPALPPSTGPIEATTPTAGAAPVATGPVEPSGAEEEDPWKGEFEAQVEEWRAKSAEARTKAEHERARWETIRKHEEEERLALGQEPENWDSLGSHITTSIAAASEILAGSTASLVSTPSRAEGAEHSSLEKMGANDHVLASQHTATESVSPSQKWVNISSPGSSFPSMSLPDPSGPPSPLPKEALPAPCPPAQSYQATEAKNANHPPSTLPSIMDHAVTKRTRLSLILSSLAINLVLPFVNGVMLGFGEIFAKNVLVGWFGWKFQSGRTAANVGFRR
ncbi:hypothetical protein ID866_4866 [Astraeus odoratus]|nr:hypothetical protein ID866_4866 [Astraeus odoratus]